MKRKKYSSNGRIDAHVREMLKKGCTYKKGRKHGKLASRTELSRYRFPAHLATGEHRGSLLRSLGVGLKDGR